MQPSKDKILFGNAIVLEQKTFRIKLRSFVEHITHQIRVLAGVTMLTRMVKMMLVMLVKMLVWRLLERRSW